jgi:hypothetical protein
MNIFYSSDIDTPKVVVGWSTLLLRISEVSGTNLGLETGYPKVFMVFLSPSG